MLLSIIGNLLGDGDGQSTDGNDDSSGGGNDLMGSDLSGSTSDQGLMPGTNNSNGGGDDDILADGSNGGMGGMDDMGSDDDLLSDDGGMGMDGMDGEMSLDGMDDGGDDGPSSELESRVEEIENNVGSLSSTVNTVQSENEKISDSLEEIEEDIRKLLEVYEMVTQGVNPFVEGDSLSDSFEHGSGGGEGAQGTGNFGDESLFDSDVEDEDDEEIDDDIANAEAEDFLDDGMDEEDEDLEFDDVGMDDEFDEMDDGGDDEFKLDDGDNADTSSDSADGDLSFDELKSEYESGDADWEEGAASDDGADESDDPFAEADDEADTDLGFDDGADEDEAEELFAEDTAETDTAAVDTEPAATVDDPETESASTEPTGDIAWDDGGRPYLESIPSEYDTQFVVMDWLDYLVSEAGLNGAARTIKFYESIRWVSSPVEDHLQTTLNGFGGGPDVEEPEPRSALGVNHKRSLWRISQIKTPEKERKPFDEWLAQEGLDGADGDFADTDEDDELSIDIEGSEDATDDLEIDATDEAYADADVSDVDELDTDIEAGSRETDDEADVDSNSGEELVYTAVDHVDEPATDHADESAEDVTDADAYTNGTTQVVDDKSGDATFENVDIEHDDETETNSAQTIHIDESGLEGDTNRTRETAPETATETDAVWTNSTNATILRENRVAEDEFNADNGQMIWVDSDVVLSEAGADLYNTGGYARASGTETADGDGDDSLKPLFIPDEDGNLTIEPVQLLLMHDDKTDRS